MQSEEKKKSKVDRVALMMLSLSFMLRFRWLLDTCESKEEARDLVETFRKAEAEIEQGLVPAACVETGIWDSTEGETLKRFQRTARSLTPRKQRELCRLAINFTLDQCPELLDLFTDPMASLLKGQLKRKSEPKKWTAALIAEAQGLYAEFHTRVREARQFCNRNKRSTGQTAAQEDARLHPKRPKMPKAITGELQRHSSRACKSPAAIAHDWTVLVLNRKYRNLNATPDYLRRHILNADTKAETDDLVTVGFLRF